MHLTKFPMLSQRRYQIQKEKMKITQISPETLNLKLIHMFIV